MKEQTTDLRNLASREALTESDIVRPGRVDEKPFSPRSCVRASLMRSALSYKRFYVGRPVLAKLCEALHKVVAENRNIKGLHSIFQALGSEGVDEQGILDTAIEQGYHPKHGFPPSTLPPPKCDSCGASYTEVPVEISACHLVCSKCAEELPHTPW